MCYAAHPLEGSNLDLAVTQVVGRQRITGGFASEPARRTLNRTDQPSLPSRAGPADMRVLMVSICVLAEASLRLRQLLVCCGRCPNRDSIRGGLAGRTSRVEAFARRPAATSPHRVREVVSRRVTTGRSPETARPLAPLLAVPVPDVVAAGGRQLAAARHHAVPRSRTGRRSVPGVSLVRTERGLAAAARLDAGSRTGQAAKG